MYKITFIADHMNLIIVHYKQNEMHTIDTFFNIVETKITMDSTCCQIDSFQIWRYHVWLFLKKKKPN